MHLRGVRMIFRLQNASALRGVMLIYGLIIRGVLRWLLVIGRPIRAVVSDNAAYYIFA